MTITRSDGIKIILEKSEQATLFLNDEFTLCGDHFPFKILRKEVLIASKYVWGLAPEPKKEIKTDIKYSSSKTVSVFTILFIFFWRD